MKNVIYKIMLMLAILMLIGCLYVIIDESNIDNKSTDISDSIYTQESIDDSIPIISEQISDSINVEDSEPPLIIESEIPSDEPSNDIFEDEYEEVIQGIFTFYGNSVYIDSEVYLKEEELVIPSSYVYEGKEIVIEEIKNLLVKDVKRIIIPSTIKKVDVSLWYLMNELENIEVNNNNSYFASKNGILYSKDFNELIYYPIAKNYDQNCFDGVSIISNCAFLGHSKMFGDKEITLPNNIIEIKDNAFSACFLSNIIFSDNITHIGENAFSFNNLAEVKLPKNLKTLGNNAFYENIYLTEVFVNKELSEVDFDEAFENNLTTIEVDKENDFFSSIDNVVYSKDLKELIYVPFGLNINSYVVNENCEIIKSFHNAYIKEIDMSNSKVHTIGQTAFSSTNLENVKFSSFIKRIDSGAFIYSNVKNITLPEGVDYIGENAFANTSLVSISLPSSLIFLGDYCFSRCDLRSITIPRNVSFIGKSVFKYSGYLYEINVDENNMYYKSVDGVLYSKNNEILFCYPQFKNNETYSVLPGTIKLEESSFLNSDIKEIILPSSLQLIESNAFANSKLENIDFSNASIRSIGDSAFENSSLNSIYLPDTIAYLGKNAFNDCSSLKEVNIPSKISSIEEGCFAYTGIKEIVIPDNIKEIKKGAFEGSKLANITLSNNLTVLEDNVFKSCGWLTTITLPETLLSIGKDCFEFSNITSIYIPSSVSDLNDQFIGQNRVFYLINIEVNEDNQYYKSIDGNLYSKDGTKLICYCHGKREEIFYIPDGVIYINDNVLSNNFNNILHSIYIPESVLYNGYQTFYSNMIFYFQASECPDTFQPMNVSSIFSTPVLAYIYNCLLPLHPEDK